MRVKPQLGFIINVLIILSGGCCTKMAALSPLTEVHQTCATTHLRQGFVGKCGLADV